MLHAFDFDESDDPESQLVLVPVLARSRAASAVKVVDIVRERIESGELRPNRPVPGINALMQEFGIARNTAIKVLKTLETEGLVAIAPGKGTFVRPDRG